MTKFPSNKDEPTFVLRGSDPAAAKAMMAYADECSRLRAPAAKVLELKRQAVAMRKYNEEEFRG